MNPNPDRESELIRLLEQLDPQDLSHMHRVALWMLIRHKARRAWLRLMWGRWADLMR